MKNILIIIIAFAICNNSCAQFKKVIEEEESIYHHGQLIITAGGNYLLPDFLIIDTMGTPLVFHTFNEYGGGYSDIKKLKNGNYSVLSGEHLSTTQQGALLFIADTAGNIIQKIVYDTIPQGINSLLNCTDNNFLMAGISWNISPFTNNYPNVYKLDSLGNALWHKYYLNAYSWRGRTTLLQLSDNNYLVTLESSNSDLGCALLKLDTAGNVIWCKSYFRPGGSLQAVLENSDGSIMMLGYPVYQPGFHQTLYFMKVDSQGTFMWAKSYGDYFGSYLNSNYSLRHSIDGGFIISAPITPYNRTGNDLMLIKLDSLGSVEWTRSHGEDGTNEIAIDAIQSSDGGYFILGATDAGIPAAGYYFIKTDSLGIAGCQENTDTIIINNIFTTDSSIALLDTLVPVQTFSSTIHDSILSLPLLSNGCILNFVNKNDLYYSKSYPYPNPTSGKFNLNPPRNFASGDYLTVFDSMGRIVLQKEVMGKEDTDVDLSRQSKGVYLIRISVSNKISESKIVVL
jgi:hypothetical protein